MKKIALVLLIVVVGGGVARLAFERRAPLAGSQDVATADVGRGKFVVKITEPGEAKPLNARTITAPISGEISRMVPEGSHVEKGDPVVWLDTTELERSLLNAEANLLTARNEFEQKQASVDLAMFKNKMAIESAKNDHEQALSQEERAKIEHEKKVVLLENDLASEADERQARLSYESASLRVKNTLMNIKKATEDYEAGKVINKADITRAEVNLRKNEQNVELLRSQMDNAVVSAEGPGLVVYTTMYRGGTRTKVQEGDQVYRDSSIAYLPDFSAIMVLMQVKEVDINRVEVGQRAVVRVEAYQDLALNGKVTTVSKVAGRKRRYHSSGEGTSSFEVTVLVDGTDQRIRPGMTVFVDLIIHEIEDCVYVPQESVFDEGGSRVVYVHTGDGFERRKVKLGLRNENHVVVAEGLDGTERVCLRDPTKELERFSVPADES